ncbi:hypothetical protein QTH87_05970 [Variovorax sp. J22P168]|uniref:hypothetical protein n=1 Tax=Variovorax jilinensis TaxID=3053513 RepID=UPI002577F626|nr:hypothetical protein [Variovorax sp. J22P168]MDM0011985.1 hypothetical protein [Variovorax sp. J22P168]
MALHLQDQIVASLQRTLVDAAIVAPGRVQVEGVDEIPADSAPAIAIEVGPEQVEALTIKAPRTLRRTLSLVIRIVVAQNSGYRERAAEILGQVERAIHGTPQARSADGIAPEGLQLLGSEPERDGGASRVVYGIRTHWRVTYLCKEGAPDHSLAA